MLSIYKANPTASFGFVGANGVDEDISETKRYKVYTTIIATYFSDKHFFHKENKEKSAYLLINNLSLSRNPSLVKELRISLKIKILTLTKGKLHIYCAHNKYGIFL